MPATDFRTKHVGKLLSLLLLIIPALTACGSPYPAYRPVQTALLSVVGNQLQDANGRPFSFYGVSRPDLVTSCPDGSSLTQDSFSAIKSWNTSVVRLPVSLAYWNNTSGTCPDYHTIVASAIHNAESAGFFVIVTLQNGPGDQEAMAQSGSVAFWNDFIAQNANDTHLMLEPFDNPQTTSANIWRNGGIVQATNGTQQTVGMQQLVDQLNIAAPKAPIIIDGFDGGYDLTSALQNPLQGKNIIYSTFPENSNGKQLNNWEQMVSLLFPKYPLVASGFTDQSDCGNTWLKGAIAAMRMRLVGLIAANWAIATNACQGKTLLQSLDGTPSSYGKSIYDAFTARAVQVVGNQLADINGIPMKLYGASLPGFEYTCTPEAQEFALSVFQAMRSWNMNVVRIPIGAGIWLSKDPVCAGVAQLVDAAIKNAEAEHMYVLIDLQNDVEGGNQMPDASAVEFWNSFLSIYKNDSDLLVEAFGEPNNVTPAIWRDGGVTKTLNGTTFTAIGIQQLLNDINLAAPNTPVLISGLDFGYDLSMINNGYPIHGKNLVFDTHPYDFLEKSVASYPNAFGFLTSTHPVVAAEFGDTRFCDGSYLREAMPYFSQHLSGMLAWAWLPETDFCHFPSIISNLDGTPTPYGQPIHDYFVQETTQPNQHVPLTTGAPVGGSL